MSKPRRVVFVQNQLAELGGITRFCEVVGEGLLARGHRVEIGAVEPPHKGAALHYDSGIVQWTAHDTPVLEFKGRLDTYWQEVGEGAARRFSEYDAETIVIFTQLYARERTRPAWEHSDPRFGFRTIVQYHDAFSTARRGKDLARARRVFSDADLFLLLTEEDAVSFQRAGFNNTGYIFNPIEVEGKPSSSVTEPVVVSLGRYDPQKSLDHLIQAWELLAEEFPSWRLELYGDGPLRDELAELIRTLGLSHSIGLMGRTSDVESVLSKSSINAISSQHEGLPFALMEASSVGVPNVSYDCAPGVREIIDDDVTGIVTKRNDPAALADGLRSLMADEKLRRRMGSAGRERMRSVFSLETILDQWEQIFDDVMR